MKPIAIVRTAWAIYLIAWLLPAAEDAASLPDTLPGFDAVLTAVAGNFESRLSALTNLVMVFSIVAVVRRSPRFMNILAWASLVSVGINAQWFNLHLRAGYFLWAGSFVVLAIGLFGLRGECTKWTRAGT